MCYFNVFQQCWERVIAEDRKYIKSLFIHYFCGKFLGQQLLHTQGKEKSLFPSVDLFSSNRQIPVTLSKAPWSCQTYSKDVLGIRVIIWSLVTMDNTLIKISSKSVTHKPEFHGSHHLQGCSSVLVLIDWSPLANSYIWPSPKLKQ